MKRVLVSALIAISLVLLPNSAEAAAIKLFAYSGLTVNGTYACQAPDGTTITCDARGYAYMSFVAQSVGGVSGCTVSILGRNDETQPNLSTLYSYTPGTTDQGYYLFGGIEYSFAISGGPCTNPVTMSLTGIKS